MSAVPVPSRSSTSSMLDSLVSRRIGRRAVGHGLNPRESPRQAPRPQWRRLASASRNAVVSASLPAVTRRWFGMPTSRMMMSCVEQRLERGVRVVHSPEQHEVRRAVVHGVAELRQFDEHAGRAAH